ncbi:hypothetical protein D1007_54773 [Hordeum vulgare]|nr:hypothetical protein D1007_54773 [Hordeum vulgare]
MAFDERKLVDPDFANIHIDRGNKAMANHWAAIQAACNKSHGIVEEMVRMFGMYRQDNSNQEFKFLHMFSRIKSCEKWREVRLALAKAKETYNPNVLVWLRQKDAPMAPKKARAARDAALAAEGLLSWIEQCIADAKSSAARREEQSDARWSALMMNQYTKLDLLRTKE